MNANFAKVKNRMKQNDGRWRNPITNKSQNKVNNTK